MAEIRREGDHTVFRIDAKERQALLDIVERIEPMIQISSWVSPRAYQEDDLEEEFRRLAGEDLMRARQADLATLREDLSGALPVRLGPD
ncbi:MAG: hypothetical protein WBU92_02530, partial [Candidatus Dormiibacterota bacterium]